MSEVPKKLAIIDGKSVFYRGYFAMPNLATKDGKPTGGVYGFSVMALEVIKRLKPDYVCVAWDKPKTNIRRRLELYPEYKAGRKPAPPDFYEQIPLLHEVLEAFGWPLYELDDYEADDIMGTLAVKATEKGIETQLITSDLDMLQLVHPLVHVYALKTGLSNIELFRPETFIMKYGIKPEQFLDLKALKGDSSDNIPGVPGVGEKGAIELLKAHKTLDGIYENLDLIKDSTRKKLEAGKELAYLSKELAAIWTDAPLELELEKLDIKNCDPLKVKEVLQRLEFRTLVRQLPEAMSVVGASLPTGAVESVELDFGKNVLISKDADLAKLPLNKANELFLHSRCAGKHGRDPLALILSIDGAEVYTLDLKKLSAKAVKSALQETVEDEKIPKIGYDLKSTIKALYSLGIKLKGVGHDVLNGAFLLNALRREQTLTELAASDLGYSGSSLEDLPTDELMQRANEFITVIHALYQQQSKALDELPKVRELALEVEWPVIPVIAAMEYEGIRLDTGYLEVMNDEVSDMISDLEQQIYGHADKEFNIGSPSQLAEILFEILKLPTLGIKKGKTGYSTAASELDKLRDLHPIIDLITQYREVTKLKNTYIDTLPKMVDEKSRLHTTYNMTQAQTGRLSSQDPNLQNIPVRTDLGKRIRKAFIASPGNVFVSADYSQFELRLAAALSGDDDMVMAFNEGKDIHQLTAAQVLGRNPEDVTKQMRYQAKAVNFGIMYGQGPHALAEQTGMTFAAAKSFIEKYFEIRPKLKAFLTETREKATKNGYVETIAGRRRPTPDVHSSNFVVREAAFRAAINMPMQGSAADIMKIAMVKVDEQFQGSNCKQLLQIHDAILVECPVAEAEETARILKETMEGAYKLPVKLVVDTSIGRNWGDL